MLSKNIACTHLLNQFVMVRLFLIWMKLVKICVRFVKTQDRYLSRSGKELKSRLVCIKNVCAETESKEVLVKKIL